ncbi:hypothetical protein BZM27_54130 [Paraburkholderia steynii]|uniref:Uncharacterized protein n=1 Tax=Paraburkholderia steynii TaxID=1245441 RepID=A0A4R0WXR0_9BURK|nr:hypothetical protein BZM27_54130 [Paraburkholderia steynii]
MPLYQIKHLVETDAPGKNLMELTQALAEKSIEFVELLRQLIYKTNEENKREIQTAMADLGHRLETVTSMQGHIKYVLEQAMSMQEEAAVVQEQVTSSAVQLVWG